MLDQPLKDADACIRQPHFVVGCEHKLINEVFLPHEIKIAYFGTKTRLHYRFIFYGLNIDIVISPWQRKIL